MSHASPAHPRAPLRTPQRFGRVALASSVLTFCAVDARAQESPGLSNELRAEYLFRTGEKKFDSGQHTEACADFTESLRILVERGDVDKATALEFAPDPEKLKMALKGIKVAAPGIL